MEEAGVTVKDYKAVKGKWNSQEELDCVTRVRQRFDEMYQAQENNCYWDNPGDSSTGSSKSSWRTHWDRMQKQVYMYKKFVKNRANLKSPMSFAPAQSAKSEFADASLGVLIKPTKEDDAVRAKKWNYQLRHWYNACNIDQANYDSYSSSVDFGTSIDYIGWVRKARDVELILTGKSIDEYVEKNPEEAKKKAKEKKPVTKKVNKVEFDDVVKIPISLFDFFIDPSARCMHGVAYEADDCIWRQTPTVENLVQELESSKDPFVMKENIKFVKDIQTANEAYGTQPFFKFPTEVEENKDKAEVLRYYKKSTDEYIVIANDVVVRKGPLPYNHKKLPFGRHVYMPLHGQFYGIGLPALLESLQSEDEVLRNLRLEQLIGEITNPIVASGEEADSFVRQMQELEPRKIVKLTGDISDSTIRPLRLQTSHVDYPAMVASIENDAVKATGINPMRYAAGGQGEAVRNNMMLLDMTQKAIKASIRHWGFGWLDEIKMVADIMQQYYPTNKIQKIDSNGKVSWEDREVVMYGKKLVEEDGKIKEEALPLDEVHTFRMTKEDMEFSRDPRIELDIDSFVPMTAALKAQTAEKVLSMFLPVISNPQIMSLPGAFEIVKWAGDAIGLPSKVLETFGDSSSADDIEKAKKQNEELLAGIELEGVYGESIAHVLEHVNLIASLQAKFMESPSKETIDTINSVYKHLKTDTTPRYAAAGAEMANVDQQKQMMMQEMMQGQGMQPGIPMGNPQQPIPMEVPPQPEGMVGADGMSQGPMINPGNAPML